MKEFEPDMDIASPPGTKVVFKFPGSGYDYDREKCARFLTLGSVYTVLKTDIGSCHTTVWLDEVPGIPFNSVNFGPHHD